MHVPSVQLKSHVPQFTLHWRDNWRWILIRDDRNLSMHRRWFLRFKNSVSLLSWKVKMLLLSFFYLGPPCEWEILPLGQVAKPFFKRPCTDIRIKPFSMELNRQDCGDRGEMISFLRRRSSKNRHGCVWRLSPEGHVEFWGDRSLWKEFMAVFLQWIRSLFELECPTL